jgi:hypothetical protein
MIAHAGGWDEILIMVAIPVGWVLVLTIRDAIKSRRARRDEETPSGHPGR